MLLFSLPFLAQRKLLYRRSILLIVTFSLLFVTFLRAQDSVNKRVDISKKSIKATQVFNEIEKEYGIEFRYKQLWIEGLVLDVNISNESLIEGLQRAFSPYGLSFIFKEPNYLILIKGSSNSFELDFEDIDEKPELLSLGNFDYQLSEATISGKIISGEDERQLVGVSIRAIESNISTVTNSQGEYTLKLPVGYHTIKINSIQSSPLELSIILNSPSKLNLKLFQNLVQLDEVSVSAKYIDENVSETVTGVERISLEEIEKLPAFLGEKDVIKSITSLPGVDFTGEASAGFNVRGSSVGNNLILLDGGTIFNSAHLFGVFSAINSDVIGSVNLYKGSIPAKYGGRLASVLDIKLKNGDKNKTSGGGGVGVMFSRFNIETPIIKEKSAVVASVRAAYPNYLLQAVNNEDLQKSSSFFGDFSFKYDHLLNGHNRIAFTSYGSNDQFSIRDETNYSYNNLSNSIYWNHYYSENLFSDISYNYSQYNYTLEEISEGTRAFDLSSKIGNHKLNLDYSYDGFANHSLSFGLNNTLVNIEPGNYNTDSTISILETQNIDKEQALESAIYLSDEFVLSKKISSYLGLRYSFFGIKEEESNVYYGGLEPRASLNFKFNARSSLKLGYNRMRQYIHLISNTASVTPVDIWKLSDFSIMPTVSDQFTIGFFKNFFSNNLETSAEIYYKDIKNLVDYKNGADLFGNNQIEEELLQGKGVAYGLELYLKKTRGRATGWVSYTYSRSLIKVAGNTREETISNGEFFPTNFDQPHNVNFLGNLQVTRRFDISVNFLYKTGRPITFPVAVYEFYGDKVAHYSERNSNRIPDYHRLDLSFHLATSLKKRKNLEASWAFTLYNVYSRRNAYSVFFQTSDNFERIDPYKLSIIGQIVPALSYNFKF